MKCWISIVKIEKLNENLLFFILRNPFLFWTLTNFSLKKFNGLLPKRKIYEILNCDKSFMAAGLRKNPANFRLFKSKFCPEILMKSEICQGDGEMPLDRWL